MQFSIGNTVRTVLSWLIIVVPLLISVLGCTTLPDGITVDCSASWLPPKHLLWLVPLLGAIAQFIKWWQGKGAGIVGAFFGKVAPVSTTGNVGTAVIVDKSGDPGTVTPGQVHAATKGTS